jgi:hypothetical protein
MKRDLPVPFLERFARRLSPYWLFCGILVGFGAMVLAGRWAGRQNLFIAYKRSYPLIAPEGYFYPSLNNLTRLVTRAVPRSKILVVVGGDSVLLGVGQDKEQLWTGELQRLLGSDFGVINLAFRGAFPTEGAAVVAEVLSKKYPHLIYVSRSFPMRFNSPVHGTYDYLFWQAKASGRLADFDARSAAINQAFRVNNSKLKERANEAALRGYFDFWSHASDLWNYLGYNFLFTVFNPLQYPPERFFEPRKNSTDTMGNLLEIPARFMPYEKEMVIVRSYGQVAVEKAGDAQLRIKSSALEAFGVGAMEAFPDSLKLSSLILLSYDAPFLSNRLSPEEHAAYEFVFRQGKSSLEKVGYHSLIVGSNFTNEDYADRTHLTAQGGKKWLVPWRPKSERWRSNSVTCRRYRPNITHRREIYVGWSNASTPTDRLRTLARVFLGFPDPQSLIDLGRA